MLFFVGECNELCLNARAIAWPSTLYLSVEKGRICNAFLQCLVRLSRSVEGPARQLRQRSGCSHVAELVKIHLAVLPFHFLEMNGACVNSYGCACLHSVNGDPVTGNALAKSINGGFCTASSRNLHFANVHQSVKERACSNDNTLGTELCTPERSHANGCPVFNKQFVSLVLPDVQSFGRIERFAPFGDVFSPIALCTRTPNGWSLAFIEHAELNRRGVGDNSHFTAQCVNFSHDLSFGDTSNGWVAAHLGYFVHVHSDKAGLSTKSCCCTGRFATRMTTPNDEDIVFEYHIIICCMYLIYMLMCW